MAVIVIMSIESYNHMSFEILHHRTENSMCLKQNIVLMGTSLRLQVTKVTAGTWARVQFTCKGVKEQVVDLSDSSISKKP